MKAAGHAQSHMQTYTNNVCNIFSLIIWFLPFHSSKELDHLYFMILPPRHSTVFSTYTENSWGFCTKPCLHQKQNRRGWCTFAHFQHFGLSYVLVCWDKSRTCCRCLVHFLEATDVRVGGNTINGHHLNLECWWCSPLLFCTCMHVMIIATMPTKHDGYLVPSSWYCIDTCRLRWKGPLIFHSHLNLEKVKSKIITAENEEIDVYFETFPHHLIMIMSFSPHLRRSWMMALMLKTFPK